MLESITHLKQTNARPSISNRFLRIKQTLLSEPVQLCDERAQLITTFFKHHNDPNDPIIIQKAKALRYLLQNKSVRIFPDELIAGNVGQYRKSAIIQPELSGLFGCQELLWIDKRKTTPFKISWKERFRLIFRVLPFWLFRNMAFRGFYPKIHQFVRYAADQLNPAYYLINEAGGIGHFLPNYPKMISLGVSGYLESLQEPAGDLQHAAQIACDGLVAFTGRLAREAEKSALRQPDKSRFLELKELARICRKVPNEPAETFHEALQSLWLTHLAVCLESINSAVSFGRMDQYLYPFFSLDIREGRLTLDHARELLLSFSAKTTEHVFLLNENLSKYHGGYLVAQAAIVGGIDEAGNDAVNDLTYIFLDVMEASGLREPNYQVRLHNETPKDMLQRSVEVAQQGKGVPAFFNDEAVVDSLVSHGYPLNEARNYGIVGCVEQALPGKSFLSTDAALFNLPVCLELALNRGRRFGCAKQVGAATQNPAHFTHIDQVVDAFTRQVNAVMKRMIQDLHVIELANRCFHPTPFSSMLVDGCLDSGRDLTAGGAIFNSSGVQGVGVADVADSLAALDTVVFQKKRIPMQELLNTLKSDFSNDPKIQAELTSARKFGNNHQQPDDYAARIVQIFHDALSRYSNTRGGPYVPGFYSSTSHVAFGEKTGALPSGRHAGHPFATSLGAANGCDRKGPTALLNSVASIDSSLAANGYALNLRFDPDSVAGKKGRRILSALIEGFFESGGMEMQFNILDPQKLEDARLNPGKYPDLVVRVAGYCAYYDDLPDAVKKEIVGRTRLNIA
jgi:formate C-acetyltransferase